jgi:flagellar biosynthesis/type III secretory pathway protein FliH
MCILIEKALSEAARKALEMEPPYQKFFTEAHRRAYDQGEAKGKAEGKAKGKAEALVMILKQRGLAMTDEQQQQLVTCTDLPTLDRWLERALSVTSLDELSPSVGRSVAGLAMEPPYQKFFTEAHRRAYDQGEAKGKAKGEAKGKAKGEAKGKAKALVMFLKQRGLAMTDEQQQQLVTCTDLPTLDRWLERALSVTSLDELLA